MIPGTINLEDLEPHRVDMSYSPTWASQAALVVKNLPASAGDVRDTGSILGLGRSPQGGHSNLLQYSCLENPMDRGTWWATVHGVAKSRTRLSDRALWLSPLFTEEYTGLRSKRWFSQPWGWSQAFTARGSGVLTPESMPFLLHRMSLWAQALQWPATIIIKQLFHRGPTVCPSIVPGPLPSLFSLQVWEVSISITPIGSDGKEAARNEGGSGSIPGSRSSPGEGNGNALQYSCLENPMDRGAWWATVHGAAKSRTRLKG